MNTEPDTNHAMFRCSCLSASVALLLAIFVFLPTRSIRVIPYDPTIPNIELPLATERGDTGPDVGCPVVTLGKNNQWIVAGVGPVSVHTLRSTLAAERDAARNFGVTAWVNVRIGANRSAKHISDFFQIAEACELDGVRIVVWEPKNYTKS